MTPTFPPQLGIDEDWSKADPVALAAAGYRFAIGYVSEDTTGKNISRAQVDALHAAGLDVGLVYEYSVMAALGSSSRGIRDAGIAVAHAQQLGAPVGIALYAAVDFNPTPDQMPTVLFYARAFDATCAAAGYRSGIYGSYAVCQYLGQSGFAGFLWQTYAWSAGRWWPGAVIQQQQNGIHVAGATVDQDQSEAPDWGQWTPTKEAAMTVLLTVHRPDGTGRTGLADGVGGWHWIPDQAALQEVQAATGLAIRDVSEDLANRAYGVVLDPPAPAPTDAAGVLAAIKQMVDAKLAAAQAA